MFSEHCNVTDRSASPMLFTFALSSLYGEKVAELKKFMMKFMYDVAGFTLQYGESQLFIKLALVSCNVRD